MSTNWTICDHNGVDLKAQLGKNQWHLWVNPRQPYCDRGHWDWGFVGLSDFDANENAPSYYFMSLDTALLEIEEFAHRAVTGLPSAVTTRSLPSYDSAMWITKKSDGSYNHMRQHKDDAVVVTVSPVNTSSGPAWIADCQGIEDLDYSDAFPRLYCHKESALSEMQRFLAWRLENTPFESVAGKINGLRAAVEQNGGCETAVSSALSDLVQTEQTTTKNKTRVEI